MPCGKNSRNPFAMILVPLERGGSRRHFESLPIEIHRRSSEISSLEFLEAGIFCSVYLGFPYVHYPPPHEEISITMFICGIRESDVFCTFSAPQAKIFLYFLFFLHGFLTFSKFPDLK